MTLVAMMPNKLPYRMYNPMVAIERPDTLIKLSILGHNEVTETAYGLEG